MRKSALKCIAVGEGYSCGSVINKIFGLPKAKIDIKNERVRELYLDTMLERWMTASDVALTVLFPIERQLCDRVFC